MKRVLLCLAAIVAFAAVQFIQATAVVPPVAALVSAGAGQAVEAGR